MRDAVARKGPAAIPKERAEGWVTVAARHILRKVKNEPSLKTLGQTVQGVRRTAKAELLLVLEKAADPKTQVMQAAFQEALGSTAEVRSLTETAIIEVKDIDEVSTQEEVLAELKEQAGVAINEAAVIAFRPAYRRTQTLTLKVSPAVAATPLGKGRIRLGWGYCRIRPKTTPRRCFKCMEFGHIATNCKSAQDYTKSAAGEGHEAPNDEFEVPAVPKGDPADEG
ncbi:uncharacterized protein LOC121404364 [Drosophila obscura]|uniref:uncharacterized protein LOC121404364 n=1 Tax=Drosophila obscura TaxID=7282 RepID=UPI001BB11720|nr:uncharacterized protein LOC121404364 [Drosophila obscura]